jgi:trimeric autotransporter adhesin
VTLNHIARWDGSTWSALRSGMDRTVFTIAVSEAMGELFAGGVFTQADGVDGTRLLARWNGASWAAVGGGITGLSVNAIAISGTDIYVGGVFTQVGDVPASCVAKWNGTSWSALGSGVTGIVPLIKAIAVSGTDVYVGGHFSHAGGVAASNIARWNGTSWFDLGTEGVAINGSLIGHVVTIAASGTDIYVGGPWTHHQMPMDCLARWDGTSWSAVG